MNLAEKLIELDKTSPKKILIIGDGMTDMYVHGREEDCQDGCKKFVTESEFIVPGGAGNAERSLSHWNCKTKLIWQPGCNEKGVMKVRFVVNNRIVYRWDNDTINYDLDLMRQEACTIFDNWRPNAVLLSDYDKGMLTPEFIQKVIRLCKVFNIPCVADAKREPEIYKGAILKGNKKWFMKYPFAVDAYRLVVTCERRPVEIWEKGWIDDPIELPPINCINHVGAGDCFAAHLTLALAHKFSLKESAEIAYSAGRVYVQRLHNHPPHPEEIVRDMNGEVSIKES